MRIGHELCRIPFEDCLKAPAPPLNTNRQLGCCRASIMKAMTRSAWLLSCTWFQSALSSGSNAPPSKIIPAIESGNSRLSENRVSRGLAIHELTGKTATSSNMIAGIVVTKRPTLLNLCGDNHRSKIPIASRSISAALGTRTAFANFQNGDMQMTHLQSPRYSITSGGNGSIFHRIRRAKD